MARYAVMECEDPLCVKDARGRGLCMTHYMRLRKEMIERGTWDPRPPAAPRPRRTPYQPADVERCGLGTRWGCGEIVNYGDQVHLLKGGRVPLIAELDNGDVIFHSRCSPAVIEPDAVQMWSGTHTARRVGSLTCNYSDGKVQTGHFLLTSRARAPVSHA